MNFLSQKLYDAYFGDEDLPTSTTNLYKLTLNKLDNNIKILDIGVGTGIYFENKDCINIIKSKNIKIHGIDINSNDINLCKDRIYNNKIQSNVSVELIDLFNIKNINDYDVIIFSESYPVIEKQLMYKMLDFIINKSNFKNKILFINNIEDNPSFIQKLKNFSFIFNLNDQLGRLVSTKDMDLIFKSLNIINITYELLASATLNYAIFKDKIKIPGLNFEMKQYLITLNLK